jgi:hypothetical protein
MNLYAELVAPRFSKQQHQLLGGVRVCRACDLQEQFEPEESGAPALFRAGFCELSPQLPDAVLLDRLMLKVLKSAQR